jgi:DNA-binding IclR family transcriptional regulator
MTPPMVRTSTRPLVQSVARCLDLLEALAAPGELGLVEIAKRTGLQPSTAHRLLATLTERGYTLQSEETGRYLLGYKLLELASFVNARTTHLRALARPYLASVQRVTGETANLTVFEPPDVVFLDQVEGTRSVRMFTQVGLAVPAHTSASGKAILAYQAPEVIDALILGGLPRLTAHTITAADELRKELGRIRRRGYAIDNEEHEEGVSCVSAPIVDFEGNVRAAISVSAPTQRIHGADIKELGELITGRAAEVSRALGYESAPATTAKRVR